MLSLCSPASSEPRGRADENAENARRCAPCQGSAAGNGDGRCGVGEGGKECDQERSELNITGMG